MIFRYLSFLVIAILALTGCEKNDNVVIYEDLDGETIQDMAIDKNGDIWFLTSRIDETAEIDPLRCSLPMKFSLSKYDHQKYTLVEESGDALMQIIFDQQNKLSDIEVDAFNRIWVSTYNKGYFILNE